MLNILCQEECVYVLRYNLCHPLIIFESDNCCEGLLLEVEGLYWNTQNFCMQARVKSMLVSLMYLCPYMYMCM
jgi:hypothetical protein